MLSSISLALTNKQIKSLQLAEAIGKEYGLSLLPAMILTESSACIDKLGDDGRSFGCMQVGLPAAKDVFKFCKNTKVCSLSFDKSDNELKLALLTDDGFNIRVGAMYFKMQLYTTRDVNRALIAYNSGLKNALKANSPTRWKYVKRVHQRNLFYTKVSLYERT